MRDRANVAASVHAPRPPPLTTILTREAESMNLLFTQMEDPGDDNGQIVPMFSSSRRLQLTTVLHEQLQANVAADGKCLLQFATRIVEVGRDPT